MKKLNIIFVRHGETIMNLDGRFCGAPDYPLSKEGIKLLEELVEKYPYEKVEHLYCSPMKRAKQTLEICFGTNKYDVVDDLKEIYFGKLETFTARSVYKNKQYKESLKRQDPDFCFEEGETLRHCAQRGVSVVKRIINDAISNGYESIGIVTHSYLMSLILDQMLIEVPKEAFILFTPNGMGIKLDVDLDKLDQTKCLKYIATMPFGAPFPNLENNPYLG